MKQSLLCLFILIMIFSSCTSMNGPGKSYTTNESLDFTEPKLAAYWDTWSTDGEPLFFAGSHRMRDREDEWQAAIEEVARQAARYVEVTGLSRFMVENGPSGKGYLGDFDYQWNISLEAGILEQLVEVKRARDDDGSYVLAKLPDGMSVNLPSQRFSWGEKPKWITEKVSIPGYRVTVGSTQQKRHPVDSLAAADIQALEEMVRSLELEISSQTNTIDLGRYGTGTKQSTMEISKATVYGFIIIDRWYDRSEGVFFSLGICPISNN